MPLITLCCRDFSGFSKQVKQKVTESSLFVQTLEEEVTYLFSVRAQTIDYGQPIKGNVTTGPQEGSPASPRSLSLAKTMLNIEIKWVNGMSGKGPILGYYIQSKKKGKPFLHSAVADYIKCTGNYNVRFICR